METDSDSDFDDLFDEDFLIQQRNKRIEEIKKTRAVQNKQEKEMVMATKQGMKVFISGPNSFISMKKGNQIIKLFGEWHGHEGCDITKLRGARVYTILEYLQQELTLGGVDLYIEAPIVHLQDPDMIKAFRDESMNIAKVGKKIPHLVETRNTLKWCIDPALRKQCPYKNVRIHSTDVRPFYVFDEIGTFLSRKIDKIDWIKFKKKYANTISTLSKIDNCKKYIVYIFNLIARQRPILKQISKSGISTGKLILAINDVCKQQKAVYWTQEYVKLINSPNPPRTPYQFDQHMSDIVQNQISIIHDIYTFLRMLRPFDKSPQNNIIFYGGLTHFDALITMLKGIGFEKIETGTQISKHCVQI